MGACKFQSTDTIDWLSDWPTEENEYIHPPSWWKNGAQQEVSLKLLIQEELFVLVTFFFLF